MQTWYDEYYLPNGIHVKLSNAVTDAKFEVDVAKDMISEKILVSNITINKLMIMIIQARRDNDEKQKMLQVGDA